MRCAFNVEVRKVKRPTPQKAESSALNTRKFTGTDNPRYLRAIQALLTRPTTREQLDQIAGCSNGPDLISNIRNLFPASDNRNEYIACEHIEFFDRDSRRCRPGVYSMMAKARRLVYQWLANRGGGSNGKRA
ncbi:MAG: hypothetical protein PHH58_10230 [Rhodoferax sp.]|nr:hypothetical protein [Rhodoferax sp.]